MVCHAAPEHREVHHHPGTRPYLKQDEIVDTWKRLVASPAPSEDFERDVEETKDSKKPERIDAGRRLIDWVVGIKGGPLEEEFKRVCTTEMAVYLYRAERADRPAAPKGDGLLAQSGAMTEEKPLHHGATTEKEEAPPIPEKSPKRMLKQKEQSEAAEKVVVDHPPVRGHPWNCGPGIR
jgi:hypothetical protein